MSFYQLMNFDFKHINLSEFDPIDYFENPNKIEAMITTTFCYDPDF